MTSVRTVRVFPGQSPRVASQHRDRLDISGFITGPKDMGKLSQIGRLRGLLLAQFGEDEAIVEDIMANNVIDFFLDNWRSGL